MIFSTGIAFYYQQIYGNFTLPFFIALVVGYMFKDRIKSSIGQLFISKASSFFYDYKIKIKDHENNLIGITKDGVKYGKICSIIWVASSAFLVITES